MHIYERICKSVTTVTLLLAPSVSWGSPHTQIACRPRYWWCVCVCVYAAPLKSWMVMMIKKAEGPKILSS